MIYQQFRCTSCKKLLFKGLLVDSEVEVKCRGCGSMNVFQGTAKDRLLCFVDPCPRRVSLEKISEMEKKLV